MGLIMDNLYPLLNRIEHIVHPIRHLVSDKLIPNIYAAHTKFYSETEFH